MALPRRPTLGRSPALRKNSSAVKKDGDETIRILSERKRTNANVPLTTPLNERQRKELEQLARMPDSQIDYSDAPALKSTPSKVYVGKIAVSNAAKHPGPVMLRFRSESQEADWWAGASGRAYVKQKSADALALGVKLKGSRLVAGLQKKASVQIALRLPEQDLANAREIAERKGIGYQTLLKMIVHEGLRREARRG